MKNVRFSYLGGGMLKVFNTKKAAKEWAQDEQHNGAYYVSYTYMTNKYSRDELLKLLTA